MSSRHLGDSVMQYMHAGTCMAGLVVCCDVVLNVSFACLQTGPRPSQQQPLQAIDVYFTV